MKEIFMVPVANKNVKAKDCEPNVVAKFKRDLRRYEKNHKTTLERDASGEYAALSLTLPKLDELLYTGNPYSQNHFLPIDCSWIEQKVKGSDRTAKASSKAASLKDLERLMIEKSLVIRAIPKIVTAIMEKSHAAEYPTGQVVYLEEYKREMLVVKQIPEHAGQFLAVKANHTSTNISFGKNLYFDSLEELIEYFSASK